MYLSNINPKKYDSITLLQNLSIYLKPQKPRKAAKTMKTMNSLFVCFFLSLGILCLKLLILQAIIVYQKRI